MNEKNAEFEPLPCNAIIYRALLRKQWIESETERIKPNAYFLRKNKNEVGISVNIASVYSPEQCAARFINCYGVVSLHTGRIRDLGLDVLQDSIYHAQIVGLPYQEDEFDRAVRLARLLANQSRIVWRP